MAELKITARPGGRTYALEYWLVESKEAGESWAFTRDHLREVRTRGVRTRGLQHKGLRTRGYSQGGYAQGWRKVTG